MMEFIKETITPSNLPIMLIMGYGFFTIHERLTRLEIAFAIMRKDKENENPGLG